MVYVDPNTPYRKLIDPFVSKEQKLALDFWVVVDKEGVKDVYNPFIEGLRKWCPSIYRRRRIRLFGTFRNMWRG
jgi:hypothetical protein